MAKISKALAVVALASISMTSVVGCDSGGSLMPSVSTTSPLSAPGSAARPGSIQACDAFRRHFQQEALREFGFDAMMEQMKRISREVSSDQRVNLKSFTATIDAPSADPESRNHAIEAIRAIYGEAIERSGLQRGTGQPVGDTRRSTLDPAGSDPLFDGYTSVLSSSVIAPGTPTVGAITEAYLAVAADQSRYEFIFMRLNSVVPSANNGFSSKGDYITMSQYIEANLPPQCAHTTTAMQAVQLNQTVAD